jgi:hypothetical protein
MEMEKLLKIGIDSISDYVGTFLLTIKKATCELEPIESREEHVILTPDSDLKGVQVRVNPRLIRFLLISIFIGSVLNTNVPGRSTAPVFVTTLIIVTGCWLCFGSIVHGICKVFGGRGSLIQTISANLQILGVIYVLSSFVAFLWGVVVGEFQLEQTSLYSESSIAQSFIRWPINSYFVAQFILVLIYVPLVNWRVHKFGFSTLPGKFTLLGATSLIQPTLLLVLSLVTTFVIVEFSIMTYHKHSVPISKREDGEGSLTNVDFETSVEFDSPSKQLPRVVQNSVAKLSKRVRVSDTEGAAVIVKTDRDRLQPTGVTKSPVISPNTRRYVGGGITLSAGWFVESETIKNPALVIAHEYSHSLDRKLTTLN